MNEFYAVMYWVVDRVYSLDELGEGLEEEEITRTETATLELMSPYLYDALNQFTRTLEKIPNELRLYRDGRYVLRAVKTASHFMHTVYNADEPINGT
jgi:hypothetical protein